MINILNRYFTYFPFLDSRETRSELVLGKRDWKYGQTCFVTTTVNRRSTFCCVKWVPLLISSFLRKAKKIISEICSQMSWRNTSGKLSVQLLIPDAFSRTQTVVKERYFFEIACDAIICDPPTTIHHLINNMLLKMIDRTFIYCYTQFKLMEEITIL